MLTVNSLQLRYILYLEHVASSPNTVYTLYTSQKKAVLDQRNRE